MATLARTRKASIDQLSLDADEVTLPKEFDARVATAAMEKASGLVATRFADDPAWIGSKYDWLRRLPPARRTKAATELLTTFAATLGIPPGPTIPGGRTLAGVKVWVRLSTLWTDGNLVFQLPQKLPRTDVIALVGVCPNEILTWFVDLPTLSSHAALVAQIGRAHV